jgi:hypothetical protein
MENGEATPSRKLYDLLKELTAEEKEKLILVLLPDTNLGARIRNLTPRARDKLIQLL